MPRNVYCDQCRKDIENNELAWFSDAENDLDFCSENCQLKWNSNDWENIHPYFTLKLKKEWKDRGFSYKQTKEWMDIGLNPWDFDYAKWLKDIKKVNSELMINHGNNEKLKKEYRNYSISTWCNKGFTDEEIIGWASVGLNSLDSEYATYLKDILKITLNKYLECLDEGNNKLLRKQYQRYLEKKDNWQENTCQEINAQEWLDQSYCDKEATTEIKWKHLTETLEGELIIENFPNLQKINVSSLFQGKLTKLKIVNCPQLRRLKCENNRLEELDIDEVSQRQLQKVNCSRNSKLKFDWNPKLASEVLSDYKILNEIESKNLSEEVYIIIDETNKLEIKKFQVQEWLDRKYPKEQRNKITKLDINSNSLQGDLDLSDFIILKELYCCNNELTSLNVGNCLQLEQIDCSNNLLTDLTLPSNPNNLKILHLGNNNFNQDLSFLLEAINLEKLWLNNNKFADSLEFLKEIKKLREFNIIDTNIDSGLEYLPESLEDFWCSTDKKKDVKCQNVFNLFKREVETEENTILWYTIKNFREELKNYQEWRKLNFSETKIRKLVSVGFRLSDYNYFQEWRKLNFTDRQSQEWVKAGAKPKDYEFVAWLRDIKKLVPLEINREEYQELLISKQSEEKINKFIQEVNLERIPYQKLSNIEHLADGGFSKIYQAEWEDRNVILKSLNNSQALTLEFLKEVASHKLFDDNTKIVKCYGISREPQGNYVMVMDYIRGGNLREYLQKNNLKLDLKKKLIQLHSIAEGLKEIHEKGLVHKDFHLGNVLSNGSESFFADLSCYITDLGLCRPASETNESEIFGVMPYLAPEVLRSQLYTQASDVYSFGIVVYGVLVGHPPYPNQPYDLSLALEICQGLRPQFQIQIPSLLEDLIKNCWNADLEKRPSAKELENQLKTWKEEVSGNKDTEFTQQVKEAEKFNQNLLEKKRFPNCKLHSEAIQHSKSINTKQINELSQKIEKISKSVEFNIDEIGEWLKNQENQSSIRLTRGMEKVELGTKTLLCYDSSQNESLFQSKKTTELTELLEIMNIEEQKCHSELIELDNNSQFSQLINFKTAELNQINWGEIEEPNWTNHNFTPSLINEWKNKWFTPHQTQDWLAIGLQPRDHQFAAWLRDIKHLTPEAVLNHHNYEQLSQEFFTYRQGQDNSLIEITPK